MSTYAGEKASFLHEALLSIVRQSVAPSELVIVLDGPVPVEQEQVVTQITSVAPFPVSLVRIATNVGRGSARNKGIEAAKEDLVALMDSDDICVPDRFEKQLAFLVQHPLVDILAGRSEEFFFDGTSLSEVGVVKYCPLDHGAIASALRWTNCVANPTIIFRKSVWSKVGGFPDYRDLNEDYLFYLRALSGGATFACIPDVVLKVRITSEQRKRRSGMRLLIADYRFRIYAWKKGYIGFLPTAVMLVMLTIRRLLPGRTGVFMQAIWRMAGKMIYRRNDAGATTKRGDA